MTGNNANEVQQPPKPDSPQDMRSTVTFRAIGGKTEMTATEYGYTSDQQFELSKAGLQECLDKMAAIFPKT